MMKFTVFYTVIFQQKGSACGGMVACDKNVGIRNSRCGGGGVLTYSSTTIANDDIKTIKNTTRTSTAITPHPQQQQQYMRILGVGAGGC